MEIGTLWHGYRALH